MRIFCCCCVTLSRIFHLRGMSHERKMSRKFFLMVLFAQLTISNIWGIHNLLTNFEEERFLTVMLAVFAFVLMPFVIVFYVIFGGSNCGLKLSTIILCTFTFFGTSLFHYYRRMGIIRGYYLAAVSISPLLGERVMRFKYGVYFFLFVIIVAFTNEFLLTDFESLSQVIGRQFFQVFMLTYSLGVSPLAVFLVFVFMDTLTEAKSEKCIRYLSSRVATFNFKDFSELIDMKKNIRNMAPFDRSFYFIIKHLQLYKMYLPHRDSIMMRGSIDDECSSFSGNSSSNVGELSVCSDSSNGSLECVSQSPEEEQTIQERSTYHETKELQMVDVTGDYLPKSIEEVETTQSEEIIVIEEIKTVVPFEDCLTTPLTPPQNWSKKPNQQANPSSTSSRHDHPSHNGRPGPAIALLRAVVLMVGVNTLKVYESEAGANKLGYESNIKLHSRVVDKLISEVKKFQGRLESSDGFGEILYFAFRDDESCVCSQYQALGAVISIIKNSFLEGLTQSRCEIRFSIVTLNSSAFECLSFGEQRKLCIIGPCFQKIRKMDDQHHRIMVNEEKAKLHDKYDLEKKAIPAAPAPVSILVDDVTKDVLTSDEDSWLDDLNIMFIDDDGGGGVKRVILME